MRFTIFTQPLLAASVIAVPAALLKRDLAAIQGAVSQVQMSLDQLGTAVDGVSATDPNSLNNVLSAATNAQNVIKTSTTTVQGSDVLALNDALTLQQAATGLTNTANKTVTSLIAKKPVFDQLGVSSVVATQLQDQKTGAGALGDAIVSKVPAVGQGIAQQSIGQINTALDQAIAAYGGAPAAAAPGAPAPPPPPPPPAGAAPAAPKAPSTTTPAPAAPADPITGLLGGLTGGAGGAGGAAANPLGGLLGGLTGGAAAPGGATGGAAAPGGAGGLGALLGGAA